MTATEMQDKVLDAAQEVIQRRGVNAMSYQDISEAVGIKKASIHYYYPTKEDLLEALIQRYSKDVLQHFDSILADKGSALSKLKQYIALYESTLAEGSNEKACLYCILGAEVMTVGSITAKRIKEFGKAQEKRLTMILDQGIKEGEFAFEGKSSDMASILFPLLQGAMLVSRTYDGVKHFSAVAKKALRLIKS